MAFIVKIMIRYNYQVQTQTPALRLLHASRRRAWIARAPEGPHTLRPEKNLVVLFSQILLNMYYFSHSVIFKIIAKVKSNKKYEAG